MKTILKSKNRKLKNSLSGIDNMNNSLSDLVETSYPYAQDESNSSNPLIASNVYYPLTLEWNLLTYLYKTHGILQTAIDIPVIDALRGGIEITSGELNSDDIDIIENIIYELDILKIIEETMIWARLYGGAAIVVNTEQNYEQPLRKSGLNKLEFYPISRWELSSVRLDNRDFYGYGGYAHFNSEFYNFYGKKIHRSRVLTLVGKTAPFLIKRQLSGWGMSEIERMMKDFNKYNRTGEVIYELLEEAKIDVYKISEFKEALSSSVGTDKIRQRISTTNRLKNFHRALLMDSTDDYIQKQLSFGGLSEILKENRIGIASALRIPMTKLFGLSASGFNAGEDDIENYNSMVEGVRENLKRTIRKIIDLILLSAFKFVPSYDFSFKSLRIMSSTEEESIKFSKHNRIMGLYDRSIIDSQEVGEIYQKEDLLPVETKASQGLIEKFPAPVISPSAPTGGISNKAKNRKRKK